MYDGLTLEEAEPQYRLGRHLYGGMPHYRRPVWLDVWGRQRVEIRERDAVR